MATAAGVLSISKRSEGLTATNLITQLSLSREARATVPEHDLEQLRFLTIDQNRSG